MTDEEKVTINLELLAADIERAIERFTENVVPVILQHPEWYEGVDKDGDKVMLDGNEIYNRLCNSIPRFEDASTDVECAGLDWFPFMDYLAGELWRKVRA